MKAWVLIGVGIAIAIFFVIELIRVGWRVPSSAYGMAAGYFFFAGFKMLRDRKAPERETDRA